MTRIVIWRSQDCVNFDLEFEQTPVKIIEKNGRSGRSNAAKSFERPERRSYSKTEHCNRSERRSFITRRRNGCLNVVLGT